MERAAAGRLLPNDLHRLFRRDLLTTGHCPALRRQPVAGRFLGFAPGESTPDRSTLSLRRERLPMQRHQLAVELILQAAEDNGLLKGQTLRVDATDLEASGSLKRIVPKGNGDDWLRVAPRHVRPRRLSWRSGLSVAPPPAAGPWR